MTPHPVTGSTAVRPELTPTYVQEVTWPTPRGRFHDLPPSNPLDHSLYLYADPHNIRTQLPQETLNLIHVVPHADLSTLERYYPNYAADPTHFLSLEGQYISRHEGRTDPTVASIPELIQYYWQRIEFFHWLSDDQEEFHVAFRYIAIRIHNVTHAARFFNHEGTLFSNHDVENHEFFFTAFLVLNPDTTL